MSTSLPLKKLVGKRVFVNLHGRFRDFAHCHMEGKVIEKNKVHLQRPLNCVITVQDHEMQRLPVATPEREWKVGQQVLVMQCIDSYWTWWEASIVKRANADEWTVRWAGEYEEYEDEVNVSKELIAPTRA
jgi:hypothetical protein